MANTILIKRKTTAGAPSLASLAVGEGCLVLPDNTLYYKKDAGTLLAFPAGAGSGTGDMLKSENLSGLSNYVTARANLDVKSAAEITTQINAAIDALVGGAPGALDTLNELAAALADDAAFSATVTAALATKLDGNSTIDGGTI